MWPEIERAQIENRREIILSGKEIDARIKKDGLDLSIFNLVELNFLRITETDLSVIPEQIGSLVNLNCLILYSNKLEGITERVSLLDKLKVLDLSRNSIKTIPDSFANLLQLVTLNVNGNKLESFPAFTKNSKLAVFDISNNSLTTFPNVCSEELTSLVELKLHGNKIEQIPSKINVLSALKIFDISSNQIKIVPGELSDCQKLKDLNLKSNPINDRRLLKLIEQRGTKQVMDYIKQHSPRTANSTVNVQVKRGKRKKSNETEENDVAVDYKYTINVKRYDENFKITSLSTVMNIRDHIVGCVVDDINFTEDSFKKFIQLQNKLHDNFCNKRHSATIATHDFNKLSSGNLTYTTLLPNELVIKPLNRTTCMTGAELVNNLQIEANNLRKEKKRSSYSGIHKYLYLIEGRPQFPCLLNEKKEVISFPPITNSDITKIEVSTTKIFIEVTSSISSILCKAVMDEFLKGMPPLFGKDMDVQQVRITDYEGKLKVLYPSIPDLIYDASVAIKIIRE